MRVRSSQFVFILLLLCSVQLRDDYILRLAAGAIAGHFGHAGQRQENPSAQQSAAEQTVTARSTAAPVLPPAVRAAWPMPRPALDAAAVSSHTSFRRA